MIQSNKRTEAKLIEQAKRARIESQANRLAKMATDCKDKGATSSEMQTTGNG
jgi:hypothetical protein